MKKRMISLLLCVVMLMGLLPTSALAAEIITKIDENDQPVGNMQNWTDAAGFQYWYFVYATTDAYYAILSSVTAPADWSADTLTMPDTLPFDAANESTSAQVFIRVIDGLFASWPESLTSVTLPSKVEIIDYGFGSSKLTSVTFPENTLKRIGDSAFSGCSLTSVTFPDSLESIGASAFSSSKLQNVTFGSGLKTLGASAFASCNSLQTVDLSNVTKLTEIPENAFKNCALASVTIPDCVTAIGESAFYAQGAAYNELSGTALRSLDLGGRETSQLQAIGAYAFGGNSGLTGTLTLPNSVRTISSGAFMEDNSMLNFFVDVPADAYYYDAVLWAAENAITSGTTDTTFSPNAPCTRAQIVTFLWRAAGSPEPKGTQSFGDVTAGSYYEKAVAWAAENGITGGTGDGKFSPGATCTRAQAVTFLYRASSASAVSSGAAFTDVAPDAYYADAVAWAAENEITGGIGGGLFAPGSNCTRAQIVTFLYRSISG